MFWNFSLQTNLESDSGATSLSIRAWLLHHMVTGDTQDSGHPGAQPRLRGCISGIWLLEMGRGGSFIQAFSRAVEPISIPGFQFSAWSQIPAWNVVHLVLIAQGKYPFYFLLCHLFRVFSGPHCFGFLFHFYF